MERDVSTAPEPISFGQTRCQEILREKKVWDLGVYTILSNRQVAKDAKDAKILRENDSFDSFLQDWNIEVDEWCQLKSCRFEI
jgi:hypothetical protein